MATMMDHVNYLRQGLLDMDEHDEQEDLLQHVRALMQPRDMLLLHAERVS